ncbi:hypothetical protein RFI_33418, partial [Reticulomyxa filosa]
CKVMLKRIEDALNDVCGRKQSNKNVATLEEFAKAMKALSSEGNKQDYWNKDKNDKSDKNNKSDRRSAKNTKLTHGDIKKIFFYYAISPVDPTTTHVLYISDFINKLRKTIYAFLEHSQKTRMDPFLIGNDPCQWIHHVCLSSFKTNDRLLHLYP